MTTPTHFVSLPKETCAMCHHFQQTTWQVLLIHSGQCTVLYVWGRWHEGRECRQAQQIGKKRKSCVIGLSLDTPQAVAEKRMKSSALSWTLPPTLLTMSWCNYGAPLASSSSTWGEPWSVSSAYSSRFPCCQATLSSKSIIVPVSVSRRVLTPGHQLNSMKLPGLDRSALLPYLA